MPKDGPMKSGSASAARATGFKKKPAACLDQVPEPTGQVPASTT
jgi:hypothetical protein